MLKNTVLNENCGNQVDFLEGNIKPRNRYPKVQGPCEHQWGLLRAGTRSLQYTVLSRKDAYRVHSEFCLRIGYDPSTNMLASEYRRLPLVSLQTSCCMKGTISPNLSNLPAEQEFLQSNNCYSNTNYVELESLLQYE